MLKRNTRGKKMMVAEFDSREELYRCFMPYVNNGGLFIKTDEDYVPGDQLILMVKLPGLKQKFTTSGKVVWLTPKSSVSRVPGVGVQFSEEDNGRLRTSIEGLLAGLLDSESATYTM
ncbi:PilZ domain-containing protein [Solemya velum gill symbiont]|nr:PilZ domain-containing protein [Solemya velum gill symbiont]